MTSDETHRLIDPEDRGDQFLNDIRAKMTTRLEQQKKKGITPTPGKLTIIRRPKKPGDPDWRDITAQLLAERQLPPLPGPHPSKLIETFIRDHLAPYLKALGYRRKVRRFWRDHGEIVDVITVLKHEFNNAWEGGFAVELGVYWKKAQEKLGGHFFAQAMPPGHCLLQHRLTKDMDKICDHWWKFKPNVDLAGLYAKVVTDLERQGFPWLKSRHDPKYIRAYLAQHRERFKRIANDSAKITAAKQAIVRNRRTG